MIPSFLFNVLGQIPFFERWCLNILSLSVACFYNAELTLLPEPSGVSLGVGRWVSAVRRYGCFAPFANRPRSLCFLIGPGCVLYYHWGAGNSLNYLSYSN